MLLVLTLEVLACRDHEAANRWRARRGCIDVRGFCGHGLRDSADGSAARGRPATDVPNHPHPDHETLRVVIAGGGVAGLETVVALRGLVGHRVALTLVAPQDEFTVRALEVFEPFGVGHPHRYPLAELAADLDAAFLRDAVARVERDDREVQLASGARLTYEVLVLAMGRPRFRV